MVDAINEALLSFEAYHQAVYTLECALAVYGNGLLEAGEYRDLVTALDGKRTVAHNTLLAKVGFLNRLADQHGLSPFYGGEVSREQPQRREVADAVFEFVHDVIVHRQ